MAFLINMLTDNQIKAALRLAEELHQPAVKNDFTARMEPILKSPDSKFFLIRLMDVAFRSKNASRISNYVLKLFRREDTGNGLFNGFETFLIKVYESVGRFFPGISIPLMLKQVKRVTSPDVPMSYSPPLVEAYLPNKKKVIDAVKSVMYLK